MGDYIEREKLQKRLDRIVDVNDLQMDRAWYTPYGINALIEEIPAADVRPVVHGHWIAEEEAEERGDYSLRDTCSVCGHCDWDCTESESFNFCPNCGADMRAKEAE